MSDFFKLKKEVSESAEGVDPDDIVPVKKRLKQFGYPRKCCGK